MMAERLTLEGLNIAECAMYFDTLSFKPLREPSVASRNIFQARQ
jgi:hypothetical protein